MEQVYINIRKYRELADMTQRELATACGYKDHTTIAKIEKGLVDISVGRLEQIAKILGVHPAVLMGWMEDDRS